MQEDAHELSSDTEHDQGIVRRRPPQRTCRKRTDRFVLEQALEEVEDYQKQTDQRTMRLKEKNKRAQQRFRERQREKSKTIAVQAIKLQQEVKDLRQKLAAAEKAAAEEAAPALVITETEGVGIKVEAFEPYLGWSVLPGVEEVHTVVLRNPRAPQSLSKRDILDLTPEQLNILLKGYVEEMTAALLDARGDAFSPSVQHLQGLNDELFALFALAHRLAPRSMMQRLREQNEPSPLDMQAICNVLKDAGLTGKQVQQLVSARVSCLAALAGLMRERHAMCKSLEMIVSGGSSWENFVSSHASMLDLQHRLMQNMEAENDAIYTFMETVLRAVLNPIQTASIIVRSFPCLPIVFPLVPLIADCSQDDPAPFPGQSDHLLSCLSTATSAQLPDAVHMFDASDSLGQSLDALFTDIYAL